MSCSSTYAADIVIDNSAEEELRTVGDGLPRAQRADVLLPVFDLRWDVRERYRKICFFDQSNTNLTPAGFEILTSLMSSVTLRW